MTAGDKCAVVVAGEILAVFLGESGRPLDSATTFERTFAGAESNTAINLSRLGLATTFLGRVGRDALGRAAIRHLRGEGVDVTAMRLDDASTGILVRSVGHEPTEVVYGRTGSAGSRLSSADIAAGVFDDAQLFHFTGITPMLSESAMQACIHACEIARATGTAISFDPNLRLRLAPAAQWRSELVKFLEVADIILTGADEALVLTGASTAADAAKLLHEHSGACVVLKNGADGARAWDGVEWIEAPVFTINSVDPVGAGDAFNAGFLAAWSEGRGLADALDQGAQLGARTVAVRGDTNGVPDVRLGQTMHVHTDVIR